MKNRIERFFIGIIEVWIQKHSSDFTRVETPDEILFTNSKGEFVLYVVERNNIYGVKDTGIVKIGNLDDSEDGYICMWHRYPDFVRYVEHIEQLPQTVLTPFVDDLIRMIRIGLLDFPRYEQFIPNELISYIRKKHGILD